MANITVSSIHEKMKQNLQFKKIQSLEQRAKEIEEVLKTLKQKQNIDNNNNLASDIVNHTILEEIRKEATKLLGLKSYTSLFGREHSSVSRKGTDDIVEAELGAVLAAIQNQATGTNLNYQDFVGGRDPVTVYTKEITTQVIDRVAKKISSSSQKLPKQGEGWSARAKKTDVQGIINITGNMAPEYNRLVSLFSNITFTIKNYSSKYEVDSLSLGKTNPDKALRGALYYLGYRRNFDMAIKALNNDPEHTGHLIFAYELAGWGQGTGIGKNFTMLPDTDFLIYNDPAVPESIAVRSTKKIIYDKIMGNTSLGRSNAIAKSYFNMKESNYKIQLNKS